MLTGGLVVSTATKVSSLLPMCKSHSVHIIRRVDAPLRAL